MPRRRTLVGLLVPLVLGGSGPALAQDSGEGGLRPRIEESPLTSRGITPPPEGGGALVPRSRSIGWRTAHDLTEAEYDAFLAQCAADGYRPISVTARQALDGPRLTVVAHADGLVDWVHARSLNAGDMTTWASDRLAEGYEPVCVAAHGADPTDTYSAVMVRSGDPRTFTLHVGLTASAYNTLVNNSVSQDRKAVWLSGTGSGTATRYAAIVTDNPSFMPWQTGWGLSDATLGSRLGELRRYGGRPAAISGFGTPDQPRLSYLAHYRRTEDWEVVHRLTLSELQQQEADFRSQGYAATTIASYEILDGVRYTALFVREPEPRVLTVTGDDVPELAAFDQAMIEHVQRCDIPSAALALVKDGRLIYARGYTYAPDGWDVTEPDTLFRVASMSKPLCATAMHQFAERGVLGLDDLMVGFAGLDGWNDDRAAQITLRYLLQHRGGWNRDTTFDPVFGYDENIANVLNIDLPIGIWDIINFMKGRNLQFNPGAQQVYSNFGFLLGARAMEAVDGRPYEQIVRQDVLAPVHVYSARVSEWTGDRPGEAPYLDGRDSRPPSVMSPEQEILKGYCYGGFNHDNGEAAGAWMLSPIDYARFLSAFEDLDASPLLPRSRIEEMWEPALGDPPDDYYYYGSGWELSRYRPEGTYRAGHTGGLPGTATMGVKMENNVTFVVLQDMREATELYEPYQILWTMFDLTLSHDQWPGHDLFPAYCASDFNRDRVTDTRDVLAFLNAWVQTDDRCDFTGDSLVDTRDLLKFLNLFSGGCA